MNGYWQDYGKRTIVAYCKALGLRKIKNLN
jgi:hypothetical protein